MIARGPIQNGKLAGWYAESWGRLPETQRPRTYVFGVGEGTAAVLSAALGGEWRAARVSDPLGRPVEARWLLLPDGTAVVESAEAIGLGRLAPDELDPLRASSAGLRNSTSTRKRRARTW